MSTIIEVVPSAVAVPTLGDFTSAVREVMVEQCGSPVVERTFPGLDIGGVTPHIELVRDIEDGHAPERFDDPSLSVDMRGFSYGWFSVEPLDVGFDFYLEYEDDSLGKYTRAEVMEECAERARKIGTLQGFPFRRAARIDWVWCIRLQAMQPLRTRLLAGFAAAALARITDGFIDSDDGGIDYDRAPTDPETFLSWYPAWIAREMHGLGR